MSVNELAVTPPTAAGNRTFNGISWLLCTFGLILPLGILLLIDSSEFERANMLAGTCMLILFGATYLSIPYAIYHKQVNRNQPPNAALTLFFMLFTGILGGIALCLVWDFVRLIQSLIVRPERRIGYAVSTPGLLRR